MGLHVQQSHVVLSNTPAVQQTELFVQVTPLAQGLQGMHEYHISFSHWSYVAAFCLPHLHGWEFDRLLQRPFDEVHIGCQVGRVYRMIPQEHDQAFAMLVVLLELVATSQEEIEERGARGP